MRGEFDWWIPVSHIHTAVMDVEVRMELEKENSVVKVLAMEDVTKAEMLDDKIQFLTAARNCGLRVPDFYPISSCQDILDLSEKSETINISTPMMTTTMMTLMMTTTTTMLELCEKSPNNFNISFSVLSGKHYFLKSLDPHSEDRLCFERIPSNEAGLRRFLQRYQTKLNRSAKYFVCEYLKVRD